MAGNPSGNSNKNADLPLPHAGRGSPPPTCNVSKRVSLSFFSRPAVLCLLSASARHMLLRCWSEWRVEGGWGRVESGSRRAPLFKTAWTWTGVPANTPRLGNRGKWLAIFTGVQKTPSHNILPPTAAQILSPQDCWVLARSLYLLDLELAGCWEASVFHI